MCRLEYALYNLGRIIKLNFKNEFIPSINCKRKKGHIEICMGEWDYIQISLRIGLASAHNVPKEAFTKLGH